MLQALIGDIIDGVLKYAFGLLSTYLESRGLIEQGKAQQYQSDLQTTVTKATDAAKVTNQVAAESDSAVSADLERLRDNSTPSGS